MQYDQIYDASDMGVVSWNGNISTTNEGGLEGDSEEFTCRFTITSGLLLNEYPLRIPHYAGSHM